MNVKGKSIYFGRLSQKHLIILFSSWPATRDVETSIEINGDEGTVENNVATEEDEVASFLASQLGSQITVGPSQGELRYIIFYLRNILY